MSGLRSEYTEISPMLKHQDGLIAQYLVAKSASQIPPRLGPATMEDIRFKDKFQSCWCRTAMPTRSLISRLAPAEAARFTRRAAPTRNEKHPSSRALAAPTVSVVLHFKVILSSEKVSVGGVSSEANDSSNNLLELVGELTERL